MKNFKENLTYFFDKAIEQPVVINRSNERFILMSEGEFLKMKEEISNLQKSLTSSLQIQSSFEELDEINLEDDADPIIDGSIESEKLGEGVK